MEKLSLPTSRSEQLRPTLVRTRVFKVTHEKN